METEKSVKKQIDYSKAKIYKIVCNTTGLTYVGSTIQKLSQRLSEHKGKYKLYLKGKTNFITSFDIIKNNNYQIILIDECPCNNKEQLLREERKYIEKLGCINKIIPTRTKKEWDEYNKQYYKQHYLDNKEKISKKKKQHYQYNKDKILEQKKKTIQCEFCNSTITAVHLRRHQRTNKCQKFQLSI